MRCIFVCFTFFIVSTIQLSAQPILNSFTNVFGEELDVQYSVEGDDKYRMWISLNERGSHSLQIDLDEVEKFYQFLSSTYSKFNEWMEIAKENQVTDLDRDIDNIRIGSSLAFSYGDWHFAFGKTQIRSNMRILEGSGYLRLIVQSRQSTRNRYIKSDTQVLTFSSSEFESLMQLFIVDSVKELVDAHNRNQSLFD